MVKVRSIRALVRLSFVAVVICCLPNTAQAIRYELIDGGGGNQVGHVLAGFIEFDSPCGGGCTSTNVIDYLFTVSGPSNYSDVYQKPDDVFLSQGSGQIFLNAGSSTLTVDYRRDGFFGLGKAPDGPGLRWYTTFGGRYVSFDEGFTRGWSADPDLLVATIGVVVPEPATIAASFLPGLLLWRKLRIRILKL